MNIISFALFGQDAKYRRGMLANIQAAPSAYPGWKLFIYCDRANYDALTELDLGNHAHCILQQESSQGVEGMSWRILAVQHPEADIVLFRDADSIFTKREVAAVQEWMDSRCDTPIIRDHPYPVSPIMGGLLGVRGAARKLLAELSAHRMKARRLTEYGDDQVFLSQDFYTRAVKSAMVHTSSVRIFPEYTRPLLPDVPGEHFIGAYAFLSDAEHEEYEAIRRNAPPKTLLPTHWKHHKIWHRLYARLHGEVARIKFSCRWCL